MARALSWLQYDRAQKWISAVPIHKHVTTICAYACNKLRQLRVQVCCRGRLTPHVLAIRDLCCMQTSAHRVANRHTTTPHKHVALCNIHHQAASWCQLLLPTICYAAAAAATAAASAATSVAAAAAIAGVTSLLHPLLQVVGNKLQQQQKQGRTSTEAHQQNCT
jgi:hypothetical protein